MAKCTECGIEAKSCGCGGSPTSCACGFTEAEIVTKKRMLRREAVILSVENEEMQPVHEFDGLGHWSKCVFCGNTRFYIQDDICPELVKQATKEEVEEEVESPKKTISKKTKKSKDNN